MEKILRKNNIFILFSAIFLSLMIGNYYLNRSFVREILANEQLGMLKNSSDKIQKYFENKKLSLSAIAQLISKFDYQKDKIIIEDILNKSQYIANFSSVYVGYEDNTMLSSKIFNMPKNYITTKRPWYQNAVKSDKIYITKPYIDTGLQIPVISISQSIKKQGDIIGVLCGVISIDDIKSKILDSKLQNGNIFLIDENFNTLFHLNEKFDFIKPNGLNFDFNKTLTYENKDEILTFKPLENSQLILVAKTLKKNIYSKINEQFIVNLVIYALSIVLFLILAYFYNNKFQKQEKIFKKHEREYEILLFQQAKMAELGQMLSALCHQWTQPLNSLGIFLGNLIQLKKLNKLSDEIFYDNITRSLQNIDYMSNAMNLFKNFYKTQGEIEKFDIIKAINDTICVLFPTKSISIKITLSKPKNSHICKNYINEFKQIIACLIQNSKQILQTDQNIVSKKIIININQNSQFFIIRIIDNGSGIKQEFLKYIFTPFKSTKGSSGLGLYISKLIANKKCKGDLFVSRAKNPTIFTLLISKRIKNDR